MHVNHLRSWRPHNSFVCGNEGYEYRHNTATYVVLLLPLRIWSHLDFLNVLLTPDWFNFIRVHQCVGHSNTHFSSRYRQKIQRLPVVLWKVVDCSVVPTSNFLYMRENGEVGWEIWPTKVVDKRSTCTDFPISYTFNCALSLLPLTFLCILFSHAIIGSQVSTLESYWSNHLHYRLTYCQHFW